MDNSGIGRRQLEDRLILRAWEDDGFRRALLENPRDLVVRELEILTGQPVQLPQDFQIKVHEESAHCLHFTLPPRRDELGDGQSLVVSWEKLLG
jgi:hypothetical protein